MEKGVKPAIQVRCTQGERELPQRRAQAAFKPTSLTGYDMEDAQHAVPETQMEAKAAPYAAPAREAHPLRRVRLEEGGVVAERRGEARAGVFSQTTTRSVGAGFQSRLQSPVCTRALCSLSRAWFSRHGGAPKLCVCC